MEPTISPAPKVATPSPQENASLTTPQSKRIEDNGKSLASNAGLLTLNATGAKPHYLGSSSAFAFSRVVAASLNQSASREAGRAAETGGSEMEPPLPRLLPEYETGVKLSNAYFQNIHPQYPFLHEPTFKLWERRVLLPGETADFSGIDPVPLYFINMVRLPRKLILRWEKLIELGIRCWSITFTQSRISSTSMICLNHLLFSKLMTFRNYIAQHGLTWITSSPWIILKPFREYYVAACSHYHQHLVHLYGNSVLIVILK